MGVDDGLDILPEVIVVVIHHANPGASVYILNEISNSL